MARDLKREGWSDTDRETKTDMLGKTEMGRERDAQAL